MKTAELSVPKMSRRTAALIQMDEQILNIILTKGQATQAKICRISGRNTATVCRSLQRLIDRGIIFVTKEEKTGKMGRLSCIYTPTGRRLDEPLQDDLWKIFYSFVKESLATDTRQDSPILDISLT